MRKTEIKDQSTEKSGMRLLKKGHRGLVHALFSRLGLFVLLLLVQIVVMLGIFRWFENILPHLYGGVALFTAVMVLYLLNSRLDATAKITWLVVIMLLPVPGALLFWYTQSEIGHRAVKKRTEQLTAESSDAVPQDEAVLRRLREASPGAASLASYINRNCCHPVYDNTEVKYFPLGEAKWEEMLRRLEAARSFIFMEYFIVDEGLMWGTVLEILARKAAEGVDVRVMYDGSCEFSLLPHDYPRRLRALGIRCKMFSPVVPLMSTHYNYRDHRKILVIDGEVAFNGGVNLADEYINRIERFGHWKDTAVMLRGEAVRSFTLMFLQMWNMDEKEPDFDRILGCGPVADGAALPSVRSAAGQADLPVPGSPVPTVPGSSVQPAARPSVQPAARPSVQPTARSSVQPAARPPIQPAAGPPIQPAAEPQGFVIPYGDCPLDSDKVGERVYMDILNRATKYVHIMSPYLILDGEMEDALKFAAQRGVEVRLILPGIPDKKAPYALAKTHYSALLDSGVEIYEYTPGFVHAKVFVADDREAVVGTINLDYRSLYHHFECATWMYGVPCVSDIEADFADTLRKCRRVGADNIWQGYRRLKVIGHVLKVIAPLM